MPTRSLRISVPTPYDLGVVLRGHGWAGLAPHELDEENLRSALDLSAVCGRGPVVDLEVGQRTPSDALRVRVSARRPLSREQLAHVRRALVRSLAVELELQEFWTRCDAVSRLAWVRRQGAGRLMCSPTLFEDLLKLLMTTNCAWSNTKAMVRRTVEGLGRRAPSGRRAFPSAKVCAREDESFWRDEVRVGYRAGHCRALAEGFASGGLEARLDPSLPTVELRRRLLALPGFGPYAVGQALRLLGHFDDLALDSWVRKRAAELHGLKPGDDRGIAARYAEFGRHAGLALWMDVTGPVGVGASE
ncbi:Fe-S cluster assembly protein HesB [Pseudenhygromyxa sp. WMMC2535]|uniref:Fe-S cluster assembly protein HesB n=1 Tax=Pseudenhygromyxa sp. WMMC2535 TaxID=2712867 RepID=UPI00155501D2|nr:Fe-S cluster assembly protein HesB [Pseudenhygromyxa sp. WMMC2535]NVB36351.1 Fe-S cluster assembly protein HesB [Pseudenhygromyxa sp. WMMC2535]